MCKYGSSIILPHFSQQILKKDSVGYEINISSMRFLNIMLLSDV